MSEYSPPDNLNPIFNPNEYLVADESLTLATADGRYLKLTCGIVGGLTTFNVRLNSAGVCNISNTTQSTAPTNGALVVSGGLGVNRNSHFNGTLHAPVGSAGSPNFSFISNPNTGIFQNGSNVVGIAANGLLRVSHSATTSTINNVLSLPTTGSASAAAALNFGTANTGLFSSGSSSLNFTVAGTQWLDITNTRASYTVPIQLSGGAQGAPSLYFQHLQQRAIISLTLIK